MSIVSRFPVIPEHTKRIFMNPESAGEHTPQLLHAVGMTSAGLPTLALKPGTKRIDKSTGFVHGHKKKVIDSPEQAMHVWLENPYRNVGLAGTDWYTVVDVDGKHGARLDDVKRILGLPLETLGWRTRSGWQLLYLNPKGFRSTKGSTGHHRLQGKFDLLGPYSLAVAPFSEVEGGTYRFMTDYWTPARLPDDWEFLDLLVDAEAVRFGRITRDDREQARKIARRQRHGAEYRVQLNGLFTERWPEHLAALQPTATMHSESHRDFYWSFDATRYTKGNKREPQILYAHLELTGWPQNPFRAKPKSDPKAYIRSTVTRAIAARTANELHRLELFADNYDLPTTALAGTSCLQAPPVPDAYNMRNGLINGGKVGVWNEQEKGELGIVLVAEWLAAFAIEAKQRNDANYVRADWWIRIPVLDLAALLGVHRNTITDAIKLGVERGWWERWIWNYRYDGGPACDSHVKLIGS